MKPITLITSVVGLALISAQCSVSEPTVGEEYDDMYFSSADIQHEQRGGHSYSANTPEAMSPFSEEAGEEGYANTDEADYYDSNYIANLNRKYSTSSVYSYGDPMYDVPTFGNPSAGMYQVGTGFGTSFGFASQRLWYDPWYSPFGITRPIHYPLYSGYSIYNDPWAYSNWGAGGYGSFMGSPYGPWSPWGNSFNRFIPVNDRPVYRTRRPGNVDRDPRYVKDNKQKNPYSNTLNGTNDSGKRGQTGASNPRKSRDYNRYDYGRERNELNNEMYSRPSSTGTRSRSTFSSPSGGSRSASPRSTGTRSGSPR
jgi:hypothetical protein